MTINCIAVMAPGDMGHAVGKVLGEHGHDVITCIAGRSARTRNLAEAGNFRLVPDLSTLVTEADMILSILPPSQALRQAEDLAAAMEAAGTTAVYVDCNAISPGTVQKVAAKLADVGASFIDCGIIGLKPGPGNEPRFYVSGPDTAAMEELDDKGIEVIAMGDGIGRASGLKMSYAALTKGTWTMHAAILMAAERMNLYDDLISEFEHSQPAALAAMERMISRLPADSGRWVREMEEIALTFREAGVPGDFHDGAAAVFRTLANTPFAEETRETIDTTRTMEQSVKVYVQHLNQDEKDAADD